MKLFLDFFPVLVFFGFYQYSDHNIVVATAALIVATVAQVGYFFLRHRRVEKMHLIILGTVLIFGGLTVALHNDTFIKWKPTIVSWLFAIILLGSHWIARTNIIRRMLEKEITLPEVVWSQLNMAWSFFFIFSGALNLYVAFSFSQQFWVNFHLFGMLGLTIVFVIGQVFWLSRYFKEETEETDPIE